MNFKYKAMTDSGSTVSGVVTAENELHARQLIAAKGYIPQMVKKGGASTAGGDGLKDRLALLGGVKPKELILFTKQLRTMIHAGISIVNALTILEQQTTNPVLKNAIIGITEDVRKGVSLTEAFKRHPKIFNELYYSMVGAGEVSGNLINVFDRLIYLVEHEYKVKKQVKSALTYPAIVTVALFGAFIFLLTFVVPKFVALFTHAGIDLPVPTQICILMYNGLNDWWHVILLSFIGLIGGVYTYVKTPQGRLTRDTLLLKIPIIGPVFQKSAMSRFASIFSLLQSSGVSVLNSLEVISRSIGNSAISRVFDNLSDKLREGRGISGPLKASPYFTPMIINMIAIGEESGNLEDMLTEVAEHYDYEVEYTVGQMSEMIGPLLMVALSGVVGFFALAIFMPMWDLTKMAG